MYIYEEIWSEKILPYRLCMNEDIGFYKIPITIIELFYYYLYLIFYYSILSWFGLLYITKFIICTTGFSNNPEPWNQNISQITLEEKKGSYIVSES